MFDAYIIFSNPQNHRLILSKESYGMEINGVKILGQVDAATSSFHSSNKNISHYFGKNGMDINLFLLNINLNINSFTFVTVFEHKSGYPSYITFANLINEVLLILVALKCL